MRYITNSVRHCIVQEVNTWNLLRHVIQQVARQMIKYCRYPSTSQYDVVTAKLIESYGVSQDCDGSTVSVLFYSIWLDDYALFLQIS